MRWKVWLGTDNQAKNLFVANIKKKPCSIVFPALLQGAVDEFCAGLVEKAGVLLLPGTLYGEGLNSFRVGFGRKNLPESLNRFEEYIRVIG